MQETVRKEKYVTIWDLFWKIIRKWRFLICMAVIFAVLVGAGKYLKDVKNIKATSNQEVKTLEEMQNDLTDEEVQQLARAFNIQTRLQNKYEYIENSVLMKLDAYNSQRAVLIYYVDTEYKVSLMEDFELDKSKDIINAYVVYLKQNGFSESLEKLIDWKKDYEYLSELIAFDYNIEANSFNVYIYGETEEQRGQICEAIANILEDYSQSLQAKVDNHKLILVDKFEVPRTDEELKEKQAKVTDEIEGLESKLDSLKVNLSSTQLMILEGEEIQQPMGTNAVLNVKFIIMGAFLGIVLGAVWIVFKFTFNKKVQFVDELSNIFGIPLLGRVDISLKNKSSKIFGKFDSWLEYLENGEAYCKEVEMEYLKINIEAICESEKIQQLFVASTQKMIPIHEVLITEMGIELGKQGLELHYLDEVLQNCNSYEKLIKAQKIILLEKVGDSKFNSIEKELVLCKQHGIKVLGSVLFY